MKKNRDILEQYLYENTLSSELILELIDEYSLYIYYLQQVYGETFVLEMRTPISSPIRYVDNNPSFSVFESNNNVYDYLWKDSALGLSGGIFKLIKEIKGYRTYDEVYQDINESFDLGIGSNVKPSRTKIILKDRPLPKETTSIRIKSKPFSEEGFEFWDKFCDRYELSVSNVSEVDYVWFTDSQSIPVIPRSLMFAYQEWDYVHKIYRHKLYSPYEEKIYKFRSDYTYGVIPGFSGLKFKSDTLILTKAEKDILTWRSLGYEAISGRSETTILPESVIHYLHTKYKRIVCWLDNDGAGWNSSYKYDLERLTIYPCLLTGIKDVSDHYKVYGKQSTKQLVEQLLAKK